MNSIVLQDKMKNKGVKMESTKIICEVINQEMRRQKVSNADLCRLSGLPIGTVYPLLRLERENVHVITLSRILGAIGKNYRWLEKQTEKAES